MGPKGVPNGVYPPSEPGMLYEMLAISVNIGQIGPGWSKPVQYAQIGQISPFWTIYGPFWDMK